MDTLQGLLDSAKLKTYRNLVIIGNSFTNGAGSTAGNEGIAYKLTPYFNHIYSYTNGGAGFGTYTGHPVSYMDLLSQAATELTELQRLNVTHILFVSAVGDDRIFTAQSDRDMAWLGTALASIRQTQLTYFPNAVTMVYLATQSSANGNGDVTSKTATYLHNGFKFLAPNHGIAYLGWGGYALARIPAMSSSDGYHPSDAGYELLAGQLFAALFGGGIAYKEFQTNIAFGNTWGNLINVRFLQTIDGIRLIFGSISRDLTYLTETDFSASLTNSAIGKTYCRPPSADSLYSYNLALRLRTNVWEPLACRVYMDDPDVSDTIKMIIPTSYITNASLNVMPFNEVFLPSTFR